MDTVPPSAPQQRTVLIVAVWLWVAVPFAYGVYNLSTQVIQLFGV